MEVSVEQKKLKHTGHSTLRRSWSLQKSVLLVHPRMVMLATAHTHAHAATSAMKRFVQHVHFKDHIYLSVMHTITSLCMLHRHATLVCGHYNRRYGPVMFSRHSDVAADVNDCCRETPEVVFTATGSFGQQSVMEQTWLTS